MSKNYLMKNVLNVTNSTIKGSIRIGDGYSDDDDNDSNQGIVIGDRKRKIVDKKKKIVKIDGTVKRVKIECDGKVFWEGQVNDEFKVDIEGTKAKITADISSVYVTGDLNGDINTTGTVEVHGNVKGRITSTGNINVDGYYVEDDDNEN